jgi:RNA polymerase sigma-70 factor (ECF subfamily)
MNRIKSALTHERHHLIIRKDGRGSMYDEPDFLSDRIEAEVLSEIFSAIERLPTECRRVFEMSYIEGMPVEQVADKLGVSVNTVKTQRSRAKKALRESLKGLYSILVLLFFIN